MMGDWRIEGIEKEAIVRYYPGVYLEGLKNSKKTLSHCSRCFCVQKGLVAILWHEMILMHSIANYIACRPKQTHRKQDPGRALHGGTPSRLQRKSVDSAHEKLVAQLHVRKYYLPHIAQCSYTSACWKELHCVVTMECKIRNRWVVSGTGTA